MPSSDAARLAALRRQRARRATAVKHAALAGLTVGAAVAIATQAHPASRTRTAPARQRINRAHVARARADHAKLTSLRASAFPTSVMSAPAFNAQAARREARTLTAGYRGQVKAVRRIRR